MFKQAFGVVITLSGMNMAAVAEAADAPQAACAPPKIAGKPMALTELPGTNLVTVPVEIDGAPKQFLLDIGTEPDRVAETTVAALHLPEVDQSTASNAMAGLNTPFQFRSTFVDVKGATASTGAVYRTYVRVASFAVAGATVDNVELPIANGRAMSKSGTYDGLFTASLFPQYDINFDFGGKQLNFVDTTSCTDPNLVAYWPHQVVAVIPMAIMKGKISVPVSIDGHPINAVIDTSSNFTVMRRDVAERALGLGSKDMTPDGDREDGMGMTIYVHTFPEIAFGGVIANNVPVRIQSNSMVRNLNRTPVLGQRATFTTDPNNRIPDLALGMDVLHQLHLYAAFGENKLYVTPAE